MADLVLDERPEVIQEGAHARLSNERFADQHDRLFIFAPSVLSDKAADINHWLLDAVRQPAIRNHYREAGIEPVEQDVAQVRAAVAERLRMVDSMREAVFGRKQSGLGLVPAAWQSQVQLHRPG